MGRRLPQLLLLLLVFVWLVLLFVQRGNCDENEHTHIAWLMGKLGQQPMVDFFQHHMPLLWDVLKIYFLVGLDGPEVLYFGHFLLVVSMLALVLGLVSLARSLASDAENAEYAVAVAMSSFIAWCLMETYAVQLRPESMAAAAWVLSLVFWRVANGRLGVLASGALFSIAVLFSPRIAILVGWFWLLAPRSISSRQLTTWLAGALGAAVLYLLVCGAPVHYLYFAVYYSALLQKIGAFDPLPSLARMPYIKMALLQSALWICVWRVSSAQGRSKSWVHLGYFAITVAVGVLSSWPHLYMQNFITSYLTMALSLLMLASRAPWRTYPVARGLVILVLGAVCTGVLVEIGSCVERHGTVFADVRFRRALLSCLAPSDTVMVTYPLHPIVARDASYFGPSLFDAPNRQGEAVSRVSDRFGLPPCDYLNVLNASAPRLIDSNLPMAVPPGDLPRLRAIMGSRYAPLDWTRAYDPAMLVFVRRDQPGVPAPTTPSTD